MKDDRVEVTKAQIEESVRAALERLPFQAESVITALQFQRRQPMTQEERTLLLSMEIFAAEAANLAVWVLHLHGEHPSAREVVRIAHAVQKAVSSALERG